MEPMNIPKDEVKRIWGDTPVKDAKKDLEVIILPDDLIGAARKDPGNCILAKACMRSFGSSKVLFFQHVAYVEMPDKNGNLMVNRYTLPKHASDLIHNFDTGKPTASRASFTLKAPAKTKTLNGLSEKNKKRKEAILMGTYIPANNNGAGVKRTPKSVQHEISVRSGSGAVQFLKENKVKK
jgi:hypothetical protein